MTAAPCTQCGGSVIDVEIVPERRLEGAHYGKAEGAAVAGTLMAVCSECESFQGERCSDCGGKVLWEWHGPGQALWVCEDCGDTDIALHAPPRPVTWRCKACDEGFYSWVEPSEKVCKSCKSGR